MYSEKYQLAGEVDEIVIDTANKRIIIVDDKPDGNAHKSEKIQVEAYCLLFRECYLPNFSLDFIHYTQSLKHFFLFWL